MAAGSGSRSGSGSPCGACKFLRRKCVVDCVFAPYFCSDQGPAQFAAIHKVFGASNVSKLLLHLPAQDRFEALVTIAFEAQARLRDPVYGCVAHIFALQQQVAYLQAQVMQVKEQLANTVVNSSNMENQWQSPINFPTTALMFENQNQSYSTRAANNMVNPKLLESSHYQDVIQHKDEGHNWI